MDFSKFADWIKLSPKYLFSISLVTGFLLFAPTDILQSFGLDAFVPKYRGWIGGVFLASGVLFIVIGGLDVLTWTQKKQRRKAVLQRGQKRLHKLTKAERKVLRQYVANNTKTAHFYIAIPSPK